MNLIEKIGLIALVPLFLLLLTVSVSAFCTSDDACSAITCNNIIGQDTQLCNGNTGNCYCGPAGCGDQECGDLENFANCPADCTAGCGNGVCDSTENTRTCPSDCQAECGNRLCETGENELNCAIDCLVESRCCEYETDAYSGQSTCILWCAVCGDGLCEPEKGEDSLTCSFDCGAFGCGDGTCSPELGEDFVSCPLDCGYMECVVDADCKGIRTCDYVVGEDYSQVDIDYFNVCSCVESNCRVSLEVKRVCGDGFCSSREGCDPLKEDFCGADCGVCLLPDLIVTEAGASKSIAREGDLVLVNAVIGNIGAAGAGPFDVALLEESITGKEAQSQRQAGLYLTQVSALVLVEDIIVYLEGENNSPLDNTAWFQGELVEKTSFVAAPNNGVIPLDVEFTVKVRDDLAGSVEKYDIDWEGDGIFDLSFTPPTRQLTHVYEKAGNHKATLRTMFTDGKPDVRMANVVALAHPINATFPIDTAGKCGHNVYYVVANPGGEVRETIRENNWVRIEFSVSCQVHPTAVLNAAPLTGNIPLTVTFDASNSFDGNGSIVSYEFDFGDGSEIVKGTGSIAQHTYEKNGIYEAALTVESTSGMGGMAFATITAGSKPIAKILATPLSGIAPLSVRLDASGSRDPDGQIVAYEWEFGNGDTESGIRVNRVFNYPGKYPVTLTVIDNDGFSAGDEASIDAFLSDKPDIAITSVEKEIRVEKNEKINLKVVIANIDGGNAGEFDVVLALGSETGPVLGRANVSSLPSLASHEIEFEFNSGNELGNFSYFVVVDPGNLLSESDKINNVEEVTVNVVLAEICGNELDDDVDGYVDEGCVEVCYNEIDDDHDNLVDEGCSEICGNELDDDGNGRVDDGCRDLDDEIPFNNIDDDHDGFVDEGFIEVCANNVDDDNDGKVDEGCEWTRAVISGEELIINLANEVPVGDEQKIKVTHSSIGDVANAEVIVISPAGKIMLMTTDAYGWATYLVSEGGKHNVKAYKYSLSAESEFAALGFWLRMEKRAFAFPALFFGAIVNDFPLLIMVLVILSLIAGVLAYDRAEGLFEERVRTRGEQRRKKLLKGLIAAAVSLVPMGVNRVYGFDLGLLIAIVEIAVLFLLIYSEKKLETPWTKR